ncbi:MAG: hypothetical protein CFE29_20930 [Bradyrhizobiaceae bacterium PARB1]|nr:MAG: hypothetical protein CFE29_20930 [Bradyrhizobiaceae bacterium PARB1]
MEIRALKLDSGDPADVAVIHLARGANPPAALEHFLKSYQLHPAGFQHQLIVAFKGYDDPQSLQRHIDLALAVGATPLLLDKDDGFDLAAYRRSAELLQHEYIVCVNSFSEILIDGWLGLLLRALLMPGMGLVGATGSWESISSTTFRGLLVHPNRTQRWNPSVLARGVKEYFVFPRFPNVHVRSNGFAIRRLDFLGIQWPDDLEHKESLHALESGCSGFTRQIQAKGLKVAVVGADGKIYPPSEWSQSRTFRSGNQENLLLADNRTRDFSKGDPEIRNWLSLTTWNTPDTPSKDRS